MEEGNAHVWKKEIRLLPHVWKEAVGRKSEIQCVRAELICEWKESDKESDKWTGVEGERQMDKVGRRAADGQGWKESSRWIEVEGERQMDRGGGKARMCGDGRRRIEWKIAEDRSGR